MVNVVCIGRESSIRRHELRLRSLGYSLHLVGSVDEYLGVTDQLGAEVVFVAESFDPDARDSVRHWIRHATPAATVIDLYEHFADDNARSAALANVANLESVVNAVSTVAPPQRAVR